MLPVKGFAAQSATSPLTPFHFKRRELTPKDILIEIHYCGICHSDLHQVRNEWHTSIYPIVPGHEIVGKVIKVGDNVLAGCGSHCVIVDHGFGINSIYAHMSAHKVQVGQTVKPGDIIGQEGAEGWAEGAHLHFEIQIAHIPVNPRTFMIGNPPPRS